MFRKYKPPHFSKRSIRWFEVQMLRKIRNRLSVYPENGNHRSIEKYLIWVLEKPWPGRTGLTDKQVFMAGCCKRALSEGLSCFRASERELAELTGLHRTTVRRSLRRLCDQGVLNKVCKDENDNTLSNHYSINRFNHYISLNFSIFAFMMRAGVWDG